MDDLKSWLTFSLRDSGLKPHGWMQAVSNWHKSCPHLNVNIVFPGMVISIIKIKWSWDHLIFIMRIPVLVRQHFYIEMGLWWLGGKGIAGDAIDRAVGNLLETHPKVKLLKSILIFSVSNHFKFLRWKFPVGANVTQIPSFQAWGSVIFITGIPVLERQNLFTEMGSKVCKNM